MTCCGIRTDNCVELLAVIYGIIGCTLSLGFALSFTVYLVYMVAFAVTNPREPAFIYAIVFLLFVVAAFVMMFGFAVFLLKGIKQRNEKYVLSYFVFGIVKTFLLLAACTGFLCWLPQEIVIIGITIGVVVAYALPLAVVWAAYRSVTRTKNYEQCVRT